MCSEQVVPDMPEQILHKNRLIVGNSPSSGCGMHKFREFHAYACSLLVFPPKNNLLFNFAVNIPFLFVLLTQRLCDSMKISYFNSLNVCVFFVVALVFSMAPRGGA